MGFRTLIEINHDIAHQIERDPDLFIRELMTQVNAGRWQRGQTIIGGRFIDMRHSHERFEVDDREFRVLDAANREFNAALRTRKETP